MIFLNNNTCMLLERLKIFSPVTYKHSLNVANIAASFGESLGLDAKTIEKLRIAGLLHDIGKLAIPNEILHKASKLNPEEYELIKSHPKYSVDLLIANGFNDLEILNIILCHHERPDGKGYPYQLSEQSIPSLAKILAIFDSYDAMQSKRSYKEANDLTYIKKELIINAQIQFDLYYVYLFLAYLDESLITLESPKVIKL